MRIELTAAERSVYARLKTPERIQRFLDDECRYNKEPDGPTCFGPRRVISERRAHCVEGALLGAAALRMAGKTAMIWDLASVRDDDHVLALVRYGRCWGAVAKSNYSGLRFREPVYRNLRELAMSYFEHYYNLAGEKTLRGFSRPVNMARFDHLNWMTSAADLWEIPEYLCEISHTNILEPGMERRLAKMDHRLFEAGKLGGVL